MAKTSSVFRKCKSQIFPFAFIFVCTLILSQSASGATLNLTAKWAANTDPDMKEYRFYRTDTGRTLIGAASYPNTSLPFAVTVADGSAGTLLFVLTAVDKNNNESADSNPASYSYDLSKVTLSGSVRDGSGAGIKGVVMSGFPGNPSTDSNGYYNVGVSVGWSGTVTPTKSGGYVFTPISRGYSNTTSDQTGQDYTGTIAELISTPKMPTGPSVGFTGTSYKFSTGGSSSNIGSSHPVEYRFDWGDGTLSNWGSSSQSYLWNVPGTYSVKAQARCKKDHDNVSAWTDPLSIPVQVKPFIQVTSPNGGENLMIGHTYTITWNSSYLTSGGALYLFYSYDGTWHPIATLSPGAASFNWTIPKMPEKVISAKPTGSIKPVSLWIGNWVDEKWECYDRNDYNFRIIYDGWLGKISGVDQGGATIMLDDGTFDGYGISLDLGMFEINGTYGVDVKGKLNGDYTIHGFGNPNAVLHTGNLGGSIDSSSKKLTLGLKTSDEIPVFNLSGKRLPADPVIPIEWTADLSGSASGDLSLDINPYQREGAFYSRVFQFVGSGSLTQGGSVNIEGYFYLTSPTVYGVYQITGTGEIGVLKGTIDLKKGAIKFNMASSNENTYALVGQSKAIP